VKKKDKILNCQEKEKNECKMNGVWNGMKWGRWRQSGVITVLVTQTQIYLDGFKLSYRATKAAGRLM
jgi:hypothetical protein